MKKFISIISLLLKNLLILWVPILLIEETFLFNYLGSEYFLTLISIIASSLCLNSYIKTYKKVNGKINCYLYNIVNAILLVIFNLVLGYFFFYLIDINIFHQCMGSGWECFLFGIEYVIIGFEYALLSAITLVIWLFIRLVKFLSSKLKNN